MDWQLVPTIFRDAMTVLFTNSSLVSNVSLHLVVYVKTVYSFGDAVTVGYNAEFMMSLKETHQ